MAAGKCVDKTCGSDFKESHSTDADHDPFNLLAETHLSLSLSDTGNNQYANVNTKPNCAAIVIPSHQYKQPEQVLRKLKVIYSTVL